VGVITWMHTFSPAKMWIHGLMDYKKPLSHLHTQYNKEIPWSEIDMDFMNLNQSAHGDREFGFITSRMRKPHKVVVGYWKDASTHSKLLPGCAFVQLGLMHRTCALSVLATT